MKYKIKVVGNGIMVKGILFSPKRYDGLYIVDEEFGKYLINTFPKEFILIEKIRENNKTLKKDLLPKEQNTTDKQQSKSRTRTRKAKPKKETE